MTTMEADEDKNSSGGEKNDESEGGEEAEVEAETSSWKEEKKKKNDEFPIGMRVLAVDDDKVCLKLLETLLMTCGYKVTVAQHAHTALQMLRENKDNYDIVITDVKMPDMDGFKLLEIVGLEMDLPVIMLSGDSEVSTVMKGIMHGARDYLVKPVRIEELKIIWKHVIRKPLHGSKMENGSTDKVEVKCEEDHTSNPTGECKEPKRERDEPKDYSDEEPSTQKRSRVVWTPELHTKFISAVNHLGLDKAVPKKILEYMDEPGITRENVASHLQKYRKALKKKNIEATRQHPGASSSSGFSTNTPNSAHFSFVNQGSNVSSSSFRVEGYQNYCRTVQINHAQHSRNGHTHMSTTRGSLPFNIQNNQRQQYLSTTQVSRSSILCVGYASDSSMIKTAAPQLMIPQAVTSRFNQPSGYIESSLPRASDMNSAPSSVTYPRFMPQERISTLSDNFNSPRVFLKDSNAVAPFRHLEHGVNTENGADLDMGAQTDGSSVICQQKQSKELITHSWEPSPFTSSNNDPSGGDLLNAFRQFQKPRGSQELIQGDSRVAIDAWQLQQ